LSLLGLEHLSLVGWGRPWHPLLTWSCQSALPLLGGQHLSLVGRGGPWQHDLLA